ncbi:MAG TPA: carbon-nitrogen hydrolase family protein [Candidatus Limnocylindrales bacterium]|nr:carbon-nitrogen hydrolase family protein [Candidatus Limnocylindrales bacterium]
MKIAVGQYAAGADKVSNVEVISDLTAQANRAGARVVVFPEGAMHTFGELSDDLRPAAEPLDGPFVDSLLRLSYRLGIIVVAGMFESIDGEQRIHNTAVVIDPRDGLVAAHRKRHLYDAFGEKESDRFRPGTDDPPLLEIDGFKTAVVTCYEIRFPAYIQQIADRGADVLLVPAAWVAGPLKEEHWNLMVRARAIENTMYVAGAGMAGVGYCARSMIVDPLGVPVAGLAEDKGIAVAELSQERLAHARARLPLVEQRRARIGVKP